MLSVRDTRSC